MCEVQRKAAELRGSVGRSRPAAPRPTPSRSSGLPRAVPKPTIAGTPTPLGACLDRVGNFGQPLLMVDWASSKLGHDTPSDQGRRGIMALQFLGKDPDSNVDNSPTIWDDGDAYVIQGWLVTDAADLAVIGDVPPHEGVVRIPKRMMPFFPEVNVDGASPHAR
jgi:hypothetical protein